ncbi:MAG: hypothetical protein SCALA702_33390 [Melioribacteraceae bacterium]|nr:MAG: hypothetical protein SCALA702_33390 [Melioribacteraceae bacterium]
MCLITFRFDPESEFPLLMAANRDEFYDRPAKTAHHWDDNPSIFAGRDLKAGGTWMGVNKSGRFAALTNFRDGNDKRTFNSSRGNLVTRFLEGVDTVAEFSRYLLKTRNDFAGYNIIFYENNSIRYFSNKLPEVLILKPGIYGLSNATLDIPWEKVKKAKSAMGKYIKGNCGDDEILFSILKDETKAEDQLLPETGVPFEWEKLLSSPFIRSEIYGTRLSTIVKMNSSEYRITELNYDSNTPTRIDNVIYF